MKRMKTLAGLVIAAAAVSVAATFAVVQAGTAASPPFHAAPAALPKLDCGPDALIVEGVATVARDPGNTTTAVNVRSPEQVVAEVLTKAQAPARLHTALDKNRTTVDFAGGQQVRLADTTGRIIGAFNIVQDPQGTYLQSEIWCAQ